jgi:hypothetical protein
MNPFQSRLRSHHGGFNLTFDILVSRYSMGSAASRAASKSSKTAAAAVKPHRANVPQGDWSARPVEDDGKVLLDNVRRLQFAVRAADTAINPVNSMESLHAYRIRSNRAQWIRGEIANLSRS